MNKSYLILGGACVVSSAIGATGGYLIAKKRFNEQLDLGIAVETEKTKKYYVDRIESLENALEEFRSEPSAVPEEELAEADDEEPELTEQDQAVIEKGRQTLKRASAAMTDYQGISGAKKPPLEEVVSNNIFDATKNKGKKALPPRGDNGKFLSKKTTEVEKQQFNDPYLIDPDVFLANTPEHEQESLLYFVHDKTLLMVADHEVVDNDKVGEVNLTLIPDDEPRVIYVRNEGGEIDYQITLTEESLTEYMGFGDGEEEEDDDDTIGDFAEEGDRRRT